ncbi:sigma-70 family RNA polymerase sigma factor [Methanococcoides sp. SA1]|nr:sigma-70 family RNA polymerase sigma factor [Methanococcoides sp. SA1]
MKKCRLSADGEKLNALGREYLEWVDFGYGVKYDRKKNLRYERWSTHPEQLEIANKIVHGLEGFIIGIAEDLSNGESYSVGKGFVSLKKIRCRPAELLSHGALAIYKNLHKYDPTYALTTHLRSDVAAAMCRGKKRDFKLVYFPTDIEEGVDKILRERIVGETAKEAIRDAFQSKRKVALSRGTLNLLSVGAGISEYQNIDGPAYVDSQKENWGDIHLGDMKVKAVDELVENKDIIEKIRSAIDNHFSGEKYQNMSPKKSLTEKTIFQKRIIEGKTLREVADIVGMKHQGVDYYEKKLRRQITTPLRKIAMVQ